MELLTISSLPSFRELSKAGIQEQANQIILHVEDGNIDPLEALVIIKKQMEILKIAEAKVRELAEGVVSMARGEVREQFSCEITQKEQGVKYDFSVCGDAEWSGLYANIATLEQLKKEREKFLKALTKEMVDAETGEVIKPAIRTGKLGLNISIK